MTAQHDHPNDHPVTYEEGYRAAHYMIAMGWGRGVRLDATAHIALTETSAFWAGFCAAVRVYEQMMESGK